MSIFSKRPSRLEILEYALEGICTQIGTHPCPNDYPNEIDEYENHQEWLVNEIRKLNLKAQNGKPT